ncbi:MAG: cytochrome P450 [Candidatus Hydrogenedentota bacterium]
MPRRIRKTYAIRSLEVFKGGDRARFRIWNQDVYLVANPDYVKEIPVTQHRNFHKIRVLEPVEYVPAEGLLTSQDDFHKRQRRMMPPVFLQQRVQGYAQIMAEYAARQADRWESMELDGRPIDMWQEMMRLTLAIVAKTLFDADVESEADEIGEALTTVIGLFERVTHPLAVLLSILPTPRNFRFVLAQSRIEKTIYRIIGERRALAEDRGDLLSMLLAAQDDEDGGGMSDKQVRDEVITLFLAGHETTANALTWTWYLLSQHPDVEAKLHSEIDELLGEALPGVADVPRLEYTRRVFAEAMRLYPPAYVIGRTALNDFELGEYTVPRGRMILLSPYVTHRNPDLFPDPERFDPDRWDPKFDAGRHKFAYYPFGGGPRTCIGEPFAWMEGILLIATLAQRWQMRLKPGHPIEYDPLITLRPKHGMIMTLHRRPGVRSTARAAVG